MLGRYRCRQIQRSLVTLPHPAPPGAAIRSRFNLSLVGRVTAPLVCLLRGEAVRPRQKALFRPSLQRSSGVVQRNLAVETVTGVSYLVLLYRVAASGPPRSA
jgi:hypothetical protein